MVVSFIWPYSLAIETSTSVTAGGSGAEEEHAESAESARTTTTGPCMITPDGNC